jgi:hypothetical protein
MQERMREEWAGHLAALHPLSRTLAAIGFVLAAYQLRVSFDREAKGALTVREWLALKPTFVVVFTAKGALMMGRAMIKMADSGYSQKIGFREDAVIRSNLAAKANIALRRVYKRFHGSELQPTSNDRLKLSRTSSGDIVTENARRVLIFRVRQTIAKPKRPNIVRF